MTSSWFLIPQLKRKFHIHSSERHTYQHTHTHTHRRTHEQLPSAMTDDRWRSWWQTMLLVLLWKIGEFYWLCATVGVTPSGMCAVRYTCVRPPESLCDMCSINCSPVCGENCQLNGAMTILRKGGDTWTWRRPSLHYFFLIFAAEIFVLTLIMERFNQYSHVCKSHIAGKANFNVTATTSTRDLPQNKTDLATLLKVFLLH